MRNTNENSSKILITNYPGYGNRVGIPSVGSSSIGFSKKIKEPAEKKASRDFSSIGRIESEEKFIEELGRDSPNYTNLNFFLIGFEPGQVRVNFIAKMVEKNQYAMDNVFRNLVSNGVSDNSYGHLVKILIDDFINPASNFNIVKDCKGVNHIFNATHHGKPELVKNILERDPDSVNIISIRGPSLIHIAVSNRMSAVLKELLNCSNLNLYALRPKKDKYKDTTIVESVFDIAKSLNKKNKIHEMLKGEHKRRFDSGDPDAIAFENTFKILLPSATIENSTMSAEGHNGNLQQAIIENREGSSAHLDQSQFSIIPAVDLDAIAFEISRASDKTINTNAEMASSIINPDAPQASSQLNAESPMVWGDPWHLQRYANLQSSAPETANMSMAEAGSENGISVFWPPFIPAVDLDAIDSEIARASDKFTNTGLQMASSLINPDQPQASFQLSAESPMVWDGNYHSDCISRLLDQGKITLGDKQIIDRILDDIQPQITGGGAMIGDTRGFILASLNTPLTGASTQITDPINENHEVKDSQSISSSIGPDTSSQSAFRPFKRTKTSSVGEFISNSEAGQSMDNGERITSRISPTSQESLSGSDKGKGGSK